MRRWLLVVLSLLLLMPTALSEPTPAVEITVEMVELSENGGTISYPQVKNHPDPAVQDLINRTVMQQGRIAEHAATLSTLAGGATGLTVTSQAHLTQVAGVPSALTVVVDARGRMPGGRPGVWTEPMMFRLSDGEIIAGASIFLNRDQAQEAIDAYILDHIVPELSVYLDPFLLTPAPIDRLTADVNGITLYYPSEDFATLSGRSVAICLTYFEVPDIWDFSPEGTLALLGATPDAWAIQPNSAQAIAAAVQKGMVPGIPAVLGDRVTDLIEQFGESLDPEYFPLGEKHQLEAAPFRKAWVISDEAGEDSVVTGIVSLRNSFFGLIPGRTQRSEGEELLGAPASSVPLDAGTAEAYGLPEGQLLTYQYGENSLLLAYGQDDLLTAVWLSAGT